MLRKGCDLEPPGPSCPALSFIVIVTELSFTELKAQ